MTADTTEATLCAILAQWFSRPASHDRAEIAADPAALAALAHKTRTTGLLLAQGEPPAGTGPEIGPEIVDEARAYRDWAARSNLRQLQQIKELASLFEAAGVEAVVFKGVARQTQVYRRLDIRIALDIDLLVPRSQYQRACLLLREGGYQAGVPDGSVWWHDYLGEAPFVRFAAPDIRVVVDLHHQLQQPGAAGPRDLGTFLESATIGAGARLPVPDPAFGMLITVISFSKGLRNREPWLSYAHELAFQWQSMSEVEQRAFLVLAGKQGLSRMTFAALRSAHDVFSLPVPALVEDSSQASDRANLQRSACGLDDDRRFLRSRLAWHWTDGPIPARVLRYVKYVAIYRLSERARRKEGFGS